MSTVLRAQDSAGFLGMLPALAGFTPRQSIVLLPFHGSRAHGAMRIDLPRPDVGASDYAAAAIRLLNRVEGTDAVAVVVYTDEAPQRTPDGLVLPVSVVVDGLLDRAEGTGLRVVDALCVTPDGWASFLHDDPALHPLDEIPGVPEVPGLGDVNGDQTTGADLPPADPVRREQVAHALWDLVEVLDHGAANGVSGGENPQALAALSLLDDMPAFFESVLETPEDLPPFVVAALLWCLDRPIFRDVAVSQWATDRDHGARTLDAQLAFSRDGVMVPDELGEIFLGRGRRPDRDRLRLALLVVRDAASSAPRDCRPGPLTVAAWLSWALGRSTHAAHHLALVREIDPGYSLAALLETMIDAAVLPEWTFRPDADDDL